jgi:hypothetical protein
MCVRMYIILCKIVRLYLRMDKIVRKWELFQTVRRFITWKENTDRISVEMYKKWKVQTKRVFLYRWKRSMDAIKHKRATISYDISRLPRIDVRSSKSKSKKVVPKSIKEIFSSMANIPAHTSSSNTDNPKLVELFQRIQRRILKENFTKWYYYYSYKIKVRKTIKERREKRRNKRKIHSAACSCHMNGCAVPCPVTCKYYIEKRYQRLYGWQEIKL